MVTANEELTALNKIIKTLETLDAETRARVLDYVNSRYAGPSAPLAGTL